MIAKTLKEAAKILTKALCPEDVFGAIHDAASLKSEYRLWAKMTHVDKYRATSDRKLAGEAFVLLQKWHGVAEDKVERGNYGNRNALATVIGDSFG